MDKYILALTNSQIEEALAKVSSHLGVTQQTLTSEQKENARTNIDVLSATDFSSISQDSTKFLKDQGIANAGKIATVDSNGNISMIHPTAIENFQCTPNDLLTFVRTGSHTSIPLGEQYSVERATSTSTSCSAGLTVTFNEATFLNKIDHVKNGQFVYKFDGLAWIDTSTSTPVSLAQYGITLSGTPGVNKTVTVNMTTESIIFDVVDHNNCCVSDESSLVLTAHDIFSYGAMPFATSQLLIYAKAALSPGKYRFTLNQGAYNGATGQDGTYIFSINTEIPAGGGIKHSTVGVYKNGYAKTDITNGTITTYNIQPEREVIESGIIVSEWDGLEICTNLGTVTAKSPSLLVPVTDLTEVNFTERNAYASNRYAHSLIRKWFNSSGKPVTGSDSTFSYWWTPSNVFDMPPSATYRKRAGFLYGLDPEFKAVIGNANVEVEIPNPDQVAGEPIKETLTDKVFLLSKTELYDGNNNNTTEGKQLAAYKNTEASAKIKLYDNSASRWWLRSPYTNAASERYVNLSGNADYYSAGGEYGIVPTVIIKAYKG